MREAAQKCSGLLHGYAENIARMCYLPPLAGWLTLTELDTYSELTNPQAVLDILLQPNVTLLPEDTLAVYLQSTLKVFGHWAAEISKRWDEDYLPETKRQVDEILSNLGRFVSNEHIEIQERVRFCLVFRVLLVLVSLTIS